MPKYIEEQEVDADEFEALKTERKLISTLEKLVVAINSDASNDGKLMEVIGKNNFAITAFMQALQSLKLELPEINIPSINLNEENITNCINSAVTTISQTQAKTNELLQTLIDSRAIEWELKRTESTKLGGILKVVATATKFKA